MSCPTNVPNYGCVNQQCSRDAQGDLIVTATACGGGVQPIRAPFNFDQCARKGGTMTLDGTGFVCGGLPTSAPPTFPPECPANLPKEWLTCQSLACPTRLNDVSGTMDVFIEGEKCSPTDPSKKSLNYNRCLNEQRAFSGYDCPASSDLTTGQIVMIVAGGLIVLVLLVLLLLKLLGSSGEEAAKPAVASSTDAAVTSVAAPAKNFAQYRQMFM